MAPKGLGYKGTSSKAKIRNKKHRLNQKSGMGSKSKNKKMKGKTQKLSYTKQ